MESPFLTVEEVATFFRKDKKWVYSVKETIPGFFKINGSIFFDRDIMIASLKELAFRPTLKKARRVSSEDQHGLL